MTRRHFPLISSLLLALSGCGDASSRPNEPVEPSVAWELTDGDFEPGSRIDAQSASLESTHPSFPWSTYTLVDNERAFHCALKGEHETIRSWISASTYFGHPSRGGSVAYEMRGVPFEEHKTQKIMHEIFAGRGTEDWIPFEQTRYVGFAFRTAETATYAQAPVAAPFDDRGETLFFQLWQGSPFRPPIAGTLEDDGAGGLRAVFSVRNTSTETCPSADQPIRVAEFPLIRGHWYKIVVGVNARHTSRGNLKIWVADSGAYDPHDATHDNDWDAPYTLIADWHGEIGYVSDRTEHQDGTPNPDQPPPTAFCMTGEQACAETHELPPCPRYPNPNLIAAIGLYRTMQPTNMKVFFDQVRVTTTFEAAKPERWSPM